MAPPRGIAAFDPPGFLPDFDGIPGQAEQWSRAVSVWFDEAIAAQAEVLRGQPCQYYNQLTKPPDGPLFEQEIVWNAFPGTLLRRWGREQACRLADHPLPLDQRMNVNNGYFQGGQWANLHYRPQDEYCEWRVQRDAQGRIIRVTFTSEPPEFWQALHGDTLETDAGTKLEFEGHPKRLVDLYREYVDPSVELADLLCEEDLQDEKDGTVLYRKGRYNPYNRWNTTQGIMHLTHPSNTLQAEIRLGADATVLRRRGRQVASDPDTLIACAGYGGQNRCSDPTIGASVNHLAALGYGITLANPVGLYMDHLDMTGWTFRNQPVDPSWFRIVRGRPGLIERAVFEVPDSEGTVSDIEIAGEPIRFGGQLAERITVKLIGVAAIAAAYQNTPARFPNRAYVLQKNPWLVGSTPVESDLPLGTMPVFDYPEAISSARIAAFDPLPPPVRPPRWSRAA